MSSTNKGNELGELDKNKFRDVNSDILNNLQNMYNNLIPLLKTKISNEYDIFKDDDILLKDDNDATTTRKLTENINHYEKYIKRKINDQINEDIEKKKLYEDILLLENSIKGIDAFKDNKKPFIYKICNPLYHQYREDQCYNYYIIYDNENFKYEIKLVEDKIEDKMQPKLINEFNDLDKLNNIKDTLNVYIITLKSQEIVDILSEYDITKFEKIIIYNEKYIILSKNKEHYRRNKHPNDLDVYKNKYILYNINDKNLYKAKIDFQEGVNVKAKRINNETIIRVNENKYDDNTELQMFNELYDSIVIKKEYIIYKEESEQKRGILSKLTSLFTGGNKKSSTYKLNGEKIALLHNNKKIQRSIYTKEKGKTKYCKINNEFILLSKLKNKIIK
jgi:hypothetical protein